MSKGYGLLFEMGCGKTLTSIAIMGAMYQAGRIERVLVVSPASVVNVWPAELEEYADFKFTAVPLFGSKDRRLKTLESLKDSNGLKVAVINYESVFREGIKDALLNYDADLVICDESQRIKSHTAKQSKAMWEIGDKARYKMILSGTPIQNNATDIWSQYRFLDKSVFGDSYYPFQNHYCVMHPVFKSKVIKNINMDELTKKAHSIAYRVRKEEALDLPEQIFETRKIEMAAKERKIYNTLKNESIVELENEETITATTVLTRLLRLQQLTGGFLIKDGEDVPEQISTAKLEALKDIIKDYVLEARKKLVVFARFLAEVDAITQMSEKLFAKTGKKAVSIQGATKKELRGDLIRQFQEDSDTVLFVGQIDTAGIGITLTAADTCVYYSKTWNYGVYEQSLSRIHRIGQKNNCVYIDLVCPKTVDEKITQALKKKDDLATNIVDNWKEIFD